MHPGWTTSFEQQQLNRFYISRCAYKNIGKTLVAQHYINCSAPQERIMISAGLKVVFLYRNLKDAIASYADHVFNLTGDAALYGYGIWNSPFFNQKETLEILKSRNISLLDAVTRAVLPSYVRMYLSWQFPSAKLLDSNSSPLYMSYEDFFANQHDSFRAIATHCGFDLDDELIEKVLADDSMDSRFNKGRPGRGEELFSRDSSALESFNRVIDCFSSSELRAVL